MLNTSQFKSNYILMAARLSNEDVPVNVKITLGSVDKRATMAISSYQVGGSFFHRQFKIIRNKICKIYMCKIMRFVLAQIYL